MEHFNELAPPYYLFIAGFATAAFAVLFVWKIVPHVVIPGAKQLLKWK